MRHRLIQRTAFPTNPTLIRATIRREERLIRTPSNLPNLQSANTERKTTWEKKPCCIGFRMKTDWRLALVPLKKIQKNAKSIEQNNFDPQKHKSTLQNGQMHDVSRCCSIDSWDLNGEQATPILRRPLPCLHSGCHIQFLQILPSKCASSWPLDRQSDLQEDWNPSENVSYLPPAAVRCEEPLLIQMQVVRNTRSCCR